MNRNIKTCWRMNGPWKHYAKWKNLDTTGDPAWLHHMKCQEKACSTLGKRVIVQEPGRGVLWGKLGALAQPQRAVEKSLAEFWTGKWYDQVCVPSSPSVGLGTGKSDGRLSQWREMAAWTPGEGGRGGPSYSRMYISVCTFLSTCWGCWLVEDTPAN